MPHRCVKCARIYTDDARELINGCSCGSRVFLFVRSLEELRRLGDIAWLEEELRAFIARRSKPISLEVENIRMLRKGVFEIDVDRLMKQEPVVVRDTFGVYYIKLPQRPSSVLAQPKG